MSLFEISVMFLLFIATVSLVCIAFFLSQIAVYFINVKWELRFINETLSKRRESDTRSDSEEA